MCETSSFFYYIIIRFCRPFGTPCSLLLSSVVSTVNGQQTDARAVRPYKLLITHFARADARTERPYKLVTI